MSKHTPGPWIWYDGCSWWRLGTEDKHDAVICPTIDHDGHPNLAVTEENRKLISTAPEGLALAEMVINLSLAMESYGPWKDFEKVLDAARALKEKANGK